MSRGDPRWKQTSESSAGASYGTCGWFLVTTSWRLPDPHLLLAVADWLLVLRLDCTAAVKARRPSTGKAPPVNGLRQTGCALWNAV